MNLGFTKEDSSCSGGDNTKLLEPVQGYHILSFQHPVTHITRPVALNRDHKGEVNSN
jgi:hypothetical protein